MPAGSGRCGAGKGGGKVDAENEREVWRLKKKRKGIKDRWAKESGGVGGHTGGEKQGGGGRRGDWKEKVGGGERGGVQLAQVTSPQDKFIQILYLIHICSL